MKNLHVIIVCFVFFLLQILVAPRIAFGPVAPDFPLLLVAYFAINRGVLHGSVAGFIVGFIQDIYAPETLGFNSLAKSITGFGIGVGGSKGEPDNGLFIMALFGIASLGHDLIYLIPFTGVHIGRLLILFVTVSIPSAIYTAVVGIIVHKLVSGLGGKVVKSFGKV